MNNLCIKKPVIKTGYIFYFYLLKEVGPTEPEPGIFFCPGGQRLPRSRGPVKRFHQGGNKFAANQQVKYHQPDVRVNNQSVQYNHLPFIELLKITAVAAFRVYASSYKRPR